MSRLQPSNRNTKQSAAVQTTAGGKVNVFNSTSTQVAVALVCGTSEVGQGVKIPRIRTVDFLPGNNEIDAADWEECKKRTEVKAWLSSVNTFDNMGRMNPTKVLIEGKVDQDFTSVSTDLMTRMADFQARRRAMGF